MKDGRYVLRVRFGSWNEVRLNVGHSELRTHLQRALVRMTFMDE